MKRISIIGCPGSGKTWLARRLSQSLGVPHIELDALHHLPNWQPRPPEQMRAAVTPLLADPAWIVDGNYASLREAVWAAADTIVWIDLPRIRATWEVLRRSITRGVTREPLWNGNREQLRNLVNPKPETNIVLWAWTRHPKYRRRYGAAMRDPRWRHAQFVRLRSRAEVDSFARDPHLRGVR